MGFKKFKRNIRHKAKKFKKFEKKIYKGEKAIGKWAYKEGRYQVKKRYFRGGHLRMGRITSDVGKGVRAYQSMRSGGLSSYGRSMGRNKYPRKSYTGGYRKSGYNRYTPYKRSYNNYKRKSYNSRGSYRNKYRSNFRKGKDIVNIMM